MEAVVTCTCGRAMWYECGRYGATVERCDCGAARVITRRTLNDVERDEARFRAAMTDPAKFNAKPCAWATGCDGWTASPRTDYCPMHCDERRATANRDTQRERMRMKRAAARA